MDIEQVRLRAEVIVTQTLLIETVRALGKAFPTFRQSLERTAKSLPQWLDQLSVPAAAPEISDLMSAELQEASQRLLERVLRPET